MCRWLDILCSHSHNYVNQSLDTACKYQTRGVRPHINKPADRVDGFTWELNPQAHVKICMSTSEVLLVALSFCKGCDCEGNHNIYNNSIGKYRSKYLCFWDGFEECMSFLLRWKSSMHYTIYSV